jgi:hypothetical protein
MLNTLPLQFLYMIGNNSAVVARVERSTKICEVKVKSDYRLYGWFSWQRKSKDKNLMELSTYPFLFHSFLVVRV